MTRERISLILEPMALFLSFHITFCLVAAAVVYPGEYFGLGSLNLYYNPQISKAMDCLSFLVVYGNVSADAIGVVCHQLGLLCTDLHAICRGGLFKVISLLCHRW